MTVESRAEFAIHDGDTVVFLGDSITAARQYSKIIEDYTLLRFPNYKVRFINAGKGGETAAGSLARLDKDVFAKGATVLTVAYGINDIGWGMRADAGHKQEYLDAIGKIVAACQEHHVRVFICSAAVTAGDPAKSEDSFLQKMCDEGMTLARSKGANAIDVQRSMREIQKRLWQANESEKDPAKKTSMHVADGIHLNDLGQLAMAYAILKGLGAPAEVSSATIDAQNEKATDSADCRISEIKRTENGLSFVRLDERSPLNLGTFWGLNFRWIPIPEELNRYLLAVKNLPEGRYEILAGGRKLGAWKNSQLAAGVNLASATADGWEPGGPWDAQAVAVKTLTEMRYEALSTHDSTGTFLKEHPGAARLQKKSDDLQKSIIALQHDMARPEPVRWLIQRAEEKPAKGKP